LKTTGGGRTLGSSAAVSFAALAIGIYVVQVMPLHIGIVACSAEGAALCYRTLDSTRLLARAALRRAVEGATAPA
jgi:hypothetical protein